MKIMVAYDGSRNARLALAQTITMFQGMSPKVMLVGVAENPRDSSDANEELFQEEYQELKKALHEGLDFITQEKLSGEVLLAEGDPRKSILRATQKHNPNLLVIARHSHQPDGGFIAKSLNYFVDELDYMTFGSVSSFLARRVEVPVLIYPS